MPVNTLFGAVEDLNEPVGLNVDRRVGIYFEGAEHLVRRRRGCLAPLRRPLCLVEGCSNAALGILILRDACRH